MAFLAGHLSRRASGVRQMIEGLSGALANRGMEIKVFGIRDPAWEQDAAEWKGAAAEVLDRFGPAKFGFMPGLGRALRTYDPDLVHLHGIWLYSSLVAAGWAGQKGRALVISPHGMLAPAALSYSPVRKRIVRALFQDRCFARAAGYHATAEAEKGDIRAYVGNVPVAVVPNGVEETSVRLPAFSERSKRVLALGRLHPVKGYERLLRAWAQVEPDFPDWKLEIAGPDPEGHGGELRRLCAELSLVRAIIGPPRYGAQRDELIAGSRLFALPSLSENFALTVPEALVCGTPVLASWGSPWEVLQEKGCGWWVDSNPNALAVALRNAMETPETRLAAMGKVGRVWAIREFGWDALAAQMENFYSKTSKLIYEK
ncbi:glycosyltransferase [Aestuariicoccus sp. MJ-SS9]|uniref:glycosyltransferase n=1 Tax=Aestuariicoccus sp. MJ-SS9 TaxID=3079855 RepID=UPI0029097549|nr:glycosyltransferase [Aestuariicoccus sp. MJ-SS9]MDU8913516.1 glycosyltransferase [Aestuariicoccus sp. MJ-SS9]